MIFGFSAAANGAATKLTKRFRNTKREDGFIVSRDAKTSIFQEPM